MNEKDIESKQIEELLRKAHLPGPSPQLHERITIAAKNAWNQTETELSWLVPFGRLVASAAASILIIWLADYTSNCSLGQWSSGLARTVNRQPAEIEALPEIPYGPFVRSLVSDNRRSSMIDASALNNHVESLWHILDETLQNGLAEPSAPAGDRSLLIPNPSSDNPYS
ncbi:MAG: hypothetical protein JXA81_09385 [Sedimentisphaerales bacterium]|nr:hypothetical protein [Sedimentisphaerales bacterium]